MAKWNSTRFLQLMSNSLEIQLILVPAGAEYRAVTRSLKQSDPQVVAIPAGPAAAGKFVENWLLENEKKFSPSDVLLMGLGGSLSDQHGVGDALMLEKVWDGSGGEEVRECDRALTHQISAQLAISTGVGVSCDRVISTVEEKDRLRRRYAADLVDMESSAVLEIFAASRQKIAVLRVISDDAHHSLPNLSNAFSPGGSIRPLPLALSFARHPVAALRLIRGSLKALKRLETLTVELFAP
jgi:hypothetical protein